MLSQVLVILSYKNCCWNCLSLSYKRQHHIFATKCNMCDFVIYDRGNTGNKNDNQLEHRVVVDEWGGGVAFTKATSHSLLQSEITDDVSTAVTSVIGLLLISLCSACMMLLWQYHWCTSWPVVSLSVPPNSIIHTKIVDAKIYWKYVMLPPRLLLNYYYSLLM